jgi:sucrose-6-phosphate hydrolase SacC (GH32 family)
MNYVHHYGTTKDVIDNEPNEKRILIGWMANWSDIKTHPATSWTSQMTIPRELELMSYKGEVVLTQKPICPATYEINCTAPETGEIGLQGFVRVGYNADKKTIFVNGYEAPYEILGRQLHLIVIVDRSSVELFTGDGARAITVALFPPLGAARGLTHFTQ